MTAYRLALASACIAAITAVAFYVGTAGTPASAVAETPSVSTAPVATAPSPSPVVVPTPAPAPQATTSYTVEAGESLWSIATALYPGRTNACYTVLYRMNAATIETAAKSHGHANSGHGRWLYAGTVLQLPTGC